MTYAESEYHPYDFANRRHIGPSPAEIAAMLEVVGAASLDALIDETVPAGIRQARAARLGAGADRAGGAAPAAATAGEEPGARPA